MENRILYEDRLNSEWEFYEALRDFGWEKKKHKKYETLWNFEYQ
jgi:hypothetical protein